MNELEKLIEYIRAESRAECAEIIQNAESECERIRTEYSQIEQKEYWKSIDSGTKETERRIERLNTLSEMEANKQIIATQQEMIAEAFELAAKKLMELPGRELAAVRTGLGLSEGCSTTDIVDKYRSVLSPRVSSALFD